MDCVFWIKSTSKVWQKYVQGRVIKIRNDVADAKWAHCSGVLNPADIPSRGLSISDTGVRKRWLCGPEFLLGDQGNWPKREPENPSHNCIQENENLSAQRARTG